MARLAGLEPEQLPFLMRLIFGRVRKMFGKDLTPSKIKARVPRAYWAAFALDYIWSNSKAVPARLRTLCYLRTAARVGCQF